MGYPAIPGIFARSFALWTGRASSAKLRVVAPDRLHLWWKPKSMSRTTCVLRVLVQHPDLLPFTISVHSGKDRRVADRVRTLFAHDGSVTPFKQRLVLSCKAFKLSGDGIIYTCN